MSTPWKSSIRICCAICRCAEWLCCRGARCPAPGAAATQLRRWQGPWVTGTLPGWDPCVQMGSWTLLPALTAGLLFQTQATAAGVGRSLCFARDSQIKAFVLCRHVMAKGNYTHLSALPLIATNWCWTCRGGGCLQTGKEQHTGVQGETTSLVSCCSQFIQREEVGDGAAVAAGEQRAAVYGPAGVCSQHRALEEAVLSLQGGERPAEGKGSRTDPQGSLPSRQLLPPLLCFGSLRLSRCVSQEMELVFEREVDGEFRQLLPLHTAGREGAEELGHHVKFPTLGFGRFCVCQQGLLSGVRNQKVGLLLHIPFKAHLNTARYG